MATPLSKQVRTLPAEQGGRVPAVAVTAYASPLERDTAIKAGYDWHLAKPIDLEELVASVVSRHQPSRGCADRRPRLPRCAAARYAVRVANLSAEALYTSPARDEDPELSHRP